MNTPHVKALKPWPGFADTLPGARRFMECSDGHVRLVKGIKTTREHWLYQPARELIASRLGVLIEAPVIPPEIVYVTEGCAGVWAFEAKKFIRWAPNPEIVIPAPGHRTAFRRIECTDATPEHLATASNREEIATAIVFLAWIGYSHDPRPHGGPYNIIITPQNRLLFIDFEGAFYEHCNRLPHDFACNLTWLSVADLDTAFARLRAIGDAVIETACRDLPDDWEVSEDTLDLLIEGLLVRRDDIESWTLFNNRWLAPATESITLFA